MAYAFRWLMGLTVSQKIIVIADKAFVVSMNSCHQHLFLHVIFMFVDHIGRGFQKASGHYLHKLSTAVLSVISGWTIKSPKRYLGIASHTPSVYAMLDIYVYFVIYLWCQSAPHSWSLPKKMVLQRDYWTEDWGPFLFQMLEKLGGNLWSSARQLKEMEERWRKGTVQCGIRVN